MKMITAWWRRVTGQPYVHSYRDGTSIWEAMLTGGFAYPTNFTLPMPAWDTTTEGENL